MTKKMDSPYQDYENDKECFINELLKMIRIW